MAGSTGSGQDIESGRRNFAESTTVFEGGRPSELDQQFNGLAAFEAGPRRDDQRPDTTVNGVIGRGWNGPEQREPGAGVLGIGAPNRGPGLVGLGGGHRISSRFLGSPGNLGETGLGGSGVIGIGGPGGPEVGPANDDIVVDVPSLPGVGLVGQGGTSFFDAPAPGGQNPGTGNGAGIVGIAGGRRAPDADLSQADLATTANAGVVGFGGDGPTPVGTDGPLIGPQSAGPGVRGIGGLTTFPGGTQAGGPGVVGVSGGSTAPPDASLAGIGVAGISDRGFGVSGRSTFTSGVDGGSTSGIGVSGRSVSQSGVEGNSTTGAGTVGASDSGVGVAGHSTHAVGGRFSSTDVAQIQLTPHSGNLEDPNGSIPGTIGDLIVLSAKRGAQMVATLWFCRIAGDGATANWAQLA